MVVLARGSVCLLALGGAACFPVPDPPWLVTRPEMLGVRVDVTAEGELSAMVASPPPDRTRTEMLPGDTATLHPWVVSPERVWNEDELDVAYFACFGVACAESLHEDGAAEPCGTIVDPGGGVCSVGRGPDAEFTLPSGPLELLSSGVPEIFAVAGVPGLADTDTCIAAVRARPFGDLGDCMLLERFVAVGPSWVVLMLQAQANGGDSDGVDTDGDGDTSGTSGTDTDGGTILPPEVFLEWPNFNPEVERFTVTITRDGVARPIDAVASDRVEVRAGDRLDVDLLADPRDNQSSAIAIANDGTVTRRVEFPIVQWYANTLVGGLDFGAAGASSISFEVPRDSPEFRIDAVIDDGRGGIGWGSLHFEVDGVPN